MAHRTAHVRLFNLEHAQSRAEYEQLLSDCLNNPTKTRMCKEPETVIKSFTSGDIDSKTTYQEVWLLVEYTTETPSPKKVDDKEIFGK